MAKKKATVKIAQTLSLTPEQVKAALEAKKGGAENVFYANQASSPKAAASPFLAQEDEMGQIGNTVKAAQKMLGSTENGHIAFTANLGKPDNDEEMQTYRDQNAAIIKRNELAGDVYEMKNQEARNQNQLIGKLNKYLSGESAFSDMSHQALRANNPYDPGGLRYTGEYAPIKAPDVPTLEKLEKMPAPIYNKVQVQVAKKPVVARGGGGEKKDDIYLTVKDASGSYRNEKQEKVGLGNDANNAMKQGGFHAYRENTVRGNDTQLTQQNSDATAYAGQLAENAIARGIASGKLDGWQFTSPDGKTFGRERLGDAMDASGRLKPGFGVGARQWEIFDKNTEKRDDGSYFNNASKAGEIKNPAKFESFRNETQRFLDQNVFNQGNPVGQQILKFGFNPSALRDRAVEHTANVLVGRGLGITNPDDSRLTRHAK